MEFGKHLGKGIWGIADKALQVIYGIGYVVLVIRELPKEEFGNFVLIQEIFLIVTALGTAFALQPLLKFAAEQHAEHREIITWSLILNGVFILVAALLSVVLRYPVSMVLNSEQLQVLLLYLPALLAGSFIRNFALVLLQSRFLLKEMFWTDAIHFLGAPLLVLYFTWMGAFHSAQDLLVINIISLSASSLLGFWYVRSIMVLTGQLTRAKFDKMWDYGRFSFGGVLSLLVYSKADTFVLSAFRGPVEVAVYNSAKVFVRMYDMATQVIQMFVLPATSRLSARGESALLKAVVEKAITFATVSLLPVSILFIAFAHVLVSVLYGGRYEAAASLLQIFSALTLFVPLIAVATNTLLGVGEARRSFILGLQMLGISVFAYLFFIPWLGSVGAAVGCVTASLGTAWVAMAAMNRRVPVTMLEVLRRVRDIRIFLTSRLRQ